MKTLNLETLVLGHGSHETREQGMGLMEAVAYFAGEEHADHPQCACPVLTSYGIALNNKLPDEPRQKLKPLIPKLVGTHNPDLEQKRMFFLLDKAVRVFTPIAFHNAASALRAASLIEHAEKLESEAAKLRALPVVDAESAKYAAKYAYALYAALYAAESAKSAAKSAKSAAKSALYAAESAKYAAKSAYALSSAEYAAKYAAKSAEYAALSANVYTLAVEAFEQAIAIEA